MNEQYSKNTLIKGYRLIDVKHFRILKRKP